MKSVKQRAEEYAATGFSGRVTYFDPVRVRDLLAGFDLAIEMLRSEGICQHNPKTRPKDCADWLEEQRGENEQT